MTITNAPKGYYPDIGDVLIDSNEEMFVWYGRWRWDVTAPENSKEPQGKCLLIYIKWNESKGHLALKREQEAKYQEQINEYRDGSGY